MKFNKLILTILLATLPLITFSQSFFEKYEDLDDVTTVVVSKHAFRLMKSLGGDTKEAQEFRTTVQSLDNLTVYSTNNKQIANDIKADVKRYLKSENLSELMRVKDKNANVKIYVREGRDDDHIKELFMIVDNFNTSNSSNSTFAIVSLTGDIDLNKIEQIVEKLDIPGKKHLKNNR